LAQEATRQDYLHEVEHMRERVARLEQAITEAVKLASPALQQLINDLQALRGIADISAVTIAAEWARYPALAVLGSRWVIVVLCPAKTPVASESDEEASLKLATRTCDESLAYATGSTRLAIAAGEIDSRFLQVILGYAREAKLNQSSPEFLPHR
jgi:hypothetical protein